MHAMLITFRSTVALDQLAEPFTAYAQAMTALPGLVSKTWLHDGATIGGFHIFEDRATADAYLNSQMLADVRANPAFSGFEVRHFEILDELSAITGSPRSSLIAR